MISLVEIVEDAKGERESCSKESGSIEREEKNVGGLKRRTSEHGLNEDRSAEHPPGRPRCISGRKRWASGSDRRLDRLGHQG